ncbi:MAG: adenosine kinase [Pseudomonadota bacterium]
MPNKTQLLGISNAIVDILVHVDDAFLERIGSEPGSMTLVDAERAREIYAMIGPAVEMSGGSVGNSIAAFANLGGRAAYIGRVADDEFGRVFHHDMTAIGIDVRLPPETREAPTAHSLILIAPDGQRTMHTYLGACTEIAPGDVTPATVGEPDYLLLEGYLWDTPHGPAAVAKAVDLAKRGGTVVALSLSDAFCVERHRAAFRELTETHAGIVVGNETEIVSLFEAEDFDTAVAAASNLPPTFALTRSERGSVIVQGPARVDVAAEPVDKVVDTTGAGDAWTAGFLYGIAEGHTLEQAAQLGSRMAAAVIQQIGPRFQQPLTALATGAS